MTTIDNDKGHEQTGDAVAPSDLVWGAKNIAKVINRTPRQAYYMLKSGKLPHKRFGNRVAVSRAALLRAFEVEA